VSILLLVSIVRRNCSSASDGAPPIATHLSVAWSVVCLSSVTLVLTPYDEFTCHLARTFVRSNDTLCHMRVREHQAKRKFWGRPPQPKHANCCPLANRKEAISRVSLSRVLIGIEKSAIVQVSTTDDYRKLVRRLC